MFDYLTFNVKEMKWEPNKTSSEGIYRDGEKWWYVHFIYGSFERVGPFDNESDAKIDYLEQRLRSCWEASDEFA